MKCHNALTLNDTIIELQALEDTTHQVKVIEYQLEQHKKGNAFNFDELEIVLDSMKRKNKKNDNSIAKMMNSLNRISLNYL